MGIIYKLTSPSGKAYIGKSTTDLVQRVRVHCCAKSTCPAIKAAIAKYGVDNFKQEVLAIASDGELNALEKHFIQMHGTYGKGGYNLTPGGEVQPMKCPEMVEKMRATRRRPDVKLKNKLVQMAVWRDPVKRESRIAGQRRVQKTAQNAPGVNERRSATMKATKALKKQQGIQGLVVDVSGVTKRRREIKAERLGISVESMIATRRAREHTGRSRGASNAWNDPVIRARRLEGIRRAHQKRRNAKNDGALHCEERDNDLCDLGKGKGMGVLSAATSEFGDKMLDKRRTRPGSQYATDEEEEESSESSDEDASVNWPALRRLQALRAHPLLRG